MGTFLMCFHHSLLHILLYYQIYSRKAMMCSRYKDLENYRIDFDNFKRIGKKKLSDYKLGKISTAEFKKWIEKSY